MAQRLVSRYPANVRLWHYTEEDYIKAQSEVVLSKSRLNKLMNLELEELRAVKDLMEKTKKAGYQEKLIKDLLEDIWKGDKFLNFPNSRLVIRVLLVQA